MLARIPTIQCREIVQVFSVKSKKQPESLAYTSGRLGFHTDLPYRDDTPGVQLLHCIENNAEGGESTLTDGFRAMADLLLLDPLSFQRLASTPVDFSWQGRSDVFVQSRKYIAQVAPRGLLAAAASSSASSKKDAQAHHTSVHRVDLSSTGTNGIETDTRGDENSIAHIYRSIVPHLQAVHLDNRNMSTSFAYERGEPLDDAHKVVRAYCRFVSLVEDRSAELRLKLQPGDVLMFDNRRCLHGRASFDASSGSRHLEGCYLDSDMLRSTYAAVDAAVTGRVADPKFATARSLSSSTS